MKLTAHSPPTTITLGFCSNASLYSSPTWIPAPTFTAPSLYSPGPLYFFVKATSLKVCVLIVRPPYADDRPMKSWPVLRITSRMLFLFANFTPAAMCFSFFATIAYSDKYPCLQLAVGSVVGKHVSFVYRGFIAHAGSLPLALQSAIGTSLKSHLPTQIIDSTIPLLQQHISLHCM
jgi:hypothetical protein